MDSVERFGAHTPFDTRHCKILVPELKADTLLVGEMVLPITPFPVSTDQVAVPMVGETAAKVVLGELIHNVWLLPALATPGKSST